MIGQPRSSQRYAGRKWQRDRALAERMVGLSRENPHYGYRRVWALLRREGWPVNKKRVHRLWRQEVRERRQGCVFLSCNNGNSALALIALAHIY